MSATTRRNTAGIPRRMAHAICGRLHVRQHTLGLLKPCIAAALVCGILAALFPAASPAAFVRLDQMGGSNDWSGAGDWVSDPDPGGSSNQVYGVTAESEIPLWAYLSLGDGIAADKTGTLFFRVRTDGNSAGIFAWAFGASDSDTPGAWSDFEGYGKMSNNYVSGTGYEGGFEMAVRDGPDDPAWKWFAEAKEDVWYNVWLVLDNADQKTTMYVTTGWNHADPSVSASGAFRQARGNDLTTLLVANNVTGTTGYITDVYLDTTGANLFNPTPEPAGMAALIGMAMVGFVALWRRRK